MRNVKRSYVYSDDTSFNASPITVDTDATVIVAANLSRLTVTLQNVGDKPCIIRFGGTPSPEAFNMVLAADTSTRQGQGGGVSIENWQGEIQGITETGSTVIAVYERVSTV